MYDHNSNQDLAIGDDCRHIFKQAYENRYTWNSDFNGIKGNFHGSIGEDIFNGNFSIDKNFKVNISDFSNSDIEKAVKSQLWEISIHRVRRSFEDVHGENTFSVLGIDNDEIEVLVGGKSSGDVYKVKNKVITMVKRHIHNHLIVIQTQNIFDTRNGYLSNSYTSQYHNPETKKPIKPISKFKDEFTFVKSIGLWFLSKRIISTINNGKEITELYKFDELVKI